MEKDIINNVSTEKVTGSNLVHVVKSALDDVLVKYGLRAGLVSKTENVRQPKKAELVIILESIRNGVYSNEHFNCDKGLYISPNSNVHTTDFISSKLVYVANSEEDMYGNIYQVGTKLITKQDKSKTVRMAVNLLNEKCVTTEEKLTVISSGKEIQPIQRKDICTGRQAIAYDPKVHKKAVHGSITSFNSVKNTITLNYYGDNPDSTEIELLTFNMCDVFSVVPKKSFNTQTIIEEEQEDTIMNTQTTFKMPNISYFGKTEDKKWEATGLVIGDYNREYCCYNILVTGLYNGKQSIVEGESIRKVMKKVISTYKSSKYINVNLIDKNNVNTLSVGDQAYIYYGESTVYACTISEIDGTNIEVEFDSKLAKALDWDEDAIDSVNVAKSKKTYILVPAKETVKAKTTKKDAGIELPRIPLFGKTEDPNWTPEKLVVRRYGEVEDMSYSMSVIGSYNGEQSTVEAGKIRKNMKKVVSPYRATKKDITVEAVTEDNIANLKPKTKAYVNYGNCIHPCRVVSVEDSTITVDFCENLMCLWDAHPEFVLTFKVGDKKLCLFTVVKEDKKVEKNSKSKALKTLEAVLKEDGEGKKAKKAKKAKAPVQEIEVEEDDFEDEDDIEELDI